MINIINLIIYFTPKNINDKIKTILYNSSNFSTFAKNYFPILW